MPLPADRFTLDRLDAYLEALWEGRESPLPEGSPHIAADGEGELVDWVYTRLRSISREPKDVFTREVGGLLEEFRSRICPWNAAAIRLFQEVVPFVATGPRRHEDWAYDVLAVLHHSVRDPRGWVRLDYAPAGTGGDTVPCYPFDPPPAPEFGDRLHPLVAEAAIAAVAIMAEEWGYERAPVRSRPDRDAVLADARTLLDRYGPAASYWTNATAAASDPAPDFIVAGLEGTNSHSFHTTEYIDGLDIVEDLGLIAVNDDEVGVFWSFEAI
jgi:hypothetical protein